MARVYNFSAGPAVLPEEVLKEAAAEMLDYKGTGMGVMEMSHRSKAYDKIIKVFRTKENLILIMNYSRGFCVPRSALSDNEELFLSFLKERCATLIQRIQIAISKIRTTKQPKKPNSSPMVTKIKSLCPSGTPALPIWVSVPFK